jgi:hypothetical protein
MDLFSSPQNYLIFFSVKSYLHPKSGIHNTKTTVTLHVVYTVPTNYEINYSNKQNITSSVWQCGVPFPVSGQVGTDQIILAVLAGLRTLVWKVKENRLKELRNGPDHPHCPRWSQDPRLESKRKQVKRI